MPVGGSVELASPATPPQVQLTYTLPAPLPLSIKIVSPGSGATYAQGQEVSANYSCTPPVGVDLRTCAGPVADGATLDTETLGQHTFTVNAEDAEGEKATTSVNYAVVAPVPNTFLDYNPKKLIKTKKTTVKVRFNFLSDVVGASFRCKLDRGHFEPCTSPMSYKVKPGKHTFSVEAVSAGGIDPTPATFSFKVTKKD